MCTPRWEGVLAEWRMRYSMKNEDWYWKAPGWLRPSLVIRWKFPDKDPDRAHPTRRDLLVSEMQLEAPLFILLISGATSCAYSATLPIASSTFYALYFRGGVEGACCMG